MEKIRVSRFELRVPPTPYHQSPFRWQSSPQPLSFVKYIEIPIRKCRIKIGEVMDLFTHIFLAYLLNFGTHELYLPLSYLPFIIPMGAIPDIDVLWSPFLGKKSPYARHRGASHSIPFVICYSLVFSIIFYYFFNLNIILFLPAAILTGLTHICCDVLTTWGVPVFWPFSKREIRFDIDRAINPYFMAFSTFNIFFLYSLSLINFNYNLYLIIIAAETLLIILYFISRVLLKLHLSKKYSIKNYQTTAIPTSGLFTWYIAAKSANQYSYKLKHGKYQFLKSKTFDCQPACPHHQSPLTLCKWGVRYRLVACSANFVSLGGHAILRSASKVV